MTSRAALPGPTTIIGDGAMASVCSILLDRRDAPLTMWCPNADNAPILTQQRVNDRYLPGHKLAENMMFTGDPAEAFDGAQLIVNAIPSQYIRSVWEKLAHHVPPNIGVISVSKGVEQETLLRPTQIIEDVLQKHADNPDKPARPLASLSGPTVADELAKRLPATATAASDDSAFALLVQQVFNTQWFRVYTHDDLLGVELAGATKNVIALAAGILDGLKAGNNAKSALLARGLAEIARLGQAMGARPETFFGISGVGDLATTCFSPTGRNRTCGEMLGKGQKLDEVLKAIPGVVEGVPTTKAVVALAEKYRVEMPITQTLALVLFHGMDPIEGIGRLMTRDVKAEQLT